MVTRVGTESSIDKLVEDLILLEHDAIAAYESCIERLSDKALGSQVDAFRHDHLQHLDTLSRMAREIGFEPPTDGDMKEYLTTGKIALADLMGDKAILKAMKTNENDTVSAYEYARDNPAIVPATRAFFEKALGDERRHRAWMERTAESL